MPEKLWKHKSLTWNFEFCEFYAKLKKNPTTEKSAKPWKKKLRYRFSIKNVFDVGHGRLQKVAQQVGIVEKISKNFNERSRNTCARFARVITLIFLYYWVH